MTDVCERCDTTIPADQTAGRMTITWAVPDVDGLQVLGLDLCRPCIDSLLAWSLPPPPLMRCA